MSAITDDEFTVLMIAAKGEYMLPIGRWEKPIYALVEKGLMFGQHLNGGLQYTITRAGKAAIAEREQEEDRQIGAIIEAGSRIGAAQKTARDQAEIAAKALADAAKASASHTGHTLPDAARLWSNIILGRALDLLNG